MTTKPAYLLLVFLFACSLMPAGAQTSWSLAGNSDAGSTSKLGTTDAAPLRLHTNNLERLRIDADGTTGIGVFSFSSSNRAKLVVNAAAGYNSFRVMVNNATKLLAGSNGGLTVGSSSGAPANGLYVAGAAGIGTNAPKSKLDILGGNGDVAATEGDLRIGNNDYRLKMGIATTGAGAGDARIRAAGGSGRLLLGADALVIDSSGNIGMGTTSPAARLDVRRSDGSYALAAFANTATTGDRSAFIDLQNGNDAPVPWRYGVGGTGNALGLTAGPFYIERVGGGVRFLISNTGNVGIGTINPQHKLSVNGTIQAKEVRVETGWADFVFDPAYRLRPLHEVAGFIAGNGHLPGVPPAKEMQEKGLELAAMSTLMMQKIEELTLYVIEQQKQINGLTEKLARLEKKKKKH